jgi:hypothetical protein
VPIKSPKKEVSPTQKYTQKYSRCQGRCGCVRPPTHFCLSQAQARQLQGAQATQEACPPPTATTLPGRLQQLSSGAPASQSVSTRARRFTMALRKEQYARRGSGGNLGTGELTSVKAPLLGQRAPVEPNLRKVRGSSCVRVVCGGLTRCSWRDCPLRVVAVVSVQELGRLCPLFLLIFVEVAALGLPIAILPIITTTEFARTRYFPDPVPIGSEIEAGSSSPPLPQRSTASTAPASVVVPTDHVRVLLQALGSCTMG